MRNVSENQLFEIIGRLYVANELSAADNRQLQQKVNEISEVLRQQAEANSTQNGKPEPETEATTN